MSDTPQVLLAHQLKALRPKLSCVSTTSWRASAPPKASITRATCSAWPSLR
jgi:hypothetical protein